MIFVGIINNLDVEFSYTLTVSNRLFAIELKEGIEHTDGLNFVDEYVNFFYHPSSNDHPINFYLSSIHGHTSFNILVWKNINHETQFYWPFPSASEPENVMNYHYNSGVQNSHSITIHPSSL